MELETSESLEKELNGRIEELQRQLEEEREEESIQMKQSEEGHLALASLEQLNVFIQENISRIDEEIEKFQAELSEMESGKDNASVEIQEKEAKIAELRKTIEDSKELYEEIEKEIREQTAKR